MSDTGERDRDPSGGREGAARVSPREDVRVVVDGLPPKRSLMRAALRWGLFLAIGVVNLAIARLVAGYLYFSRGLPDIPSPEQYRPPLITEVISSDGQIAGEFFEERRKVVPYERVPRRVVQAFIASEDKNFFEHGGIDVLGTLRAAVNTYVLRRKVQGGSTITQQTAKAILISTEGFAAGTKRHLSRKVRELILAKRLERAFTKEQILWMYLNGVYLGHHSYGVQAAAENYYRKNVEDLTLEEAALIAGLPQAPSRFSPFSRPEAAKERRRYVLRRMSEEGFITANERARAVEAGPSAQAISRVRARGCCRPWSQEARAPSSMSNRSFRPAVFALVAGGVGAGGVGWFGLVAGRPAAPPGVRPGAPGAAGAGWEVGATGPVMTGWW